MGWKASLHPFKRLVNFPIRVTNFLHKRIERARSRNPQRFQQMADVAPAMLWVTAPYGVCTFLSEGWYHYTGQTEATGLGYGWIDAVHPEDREHARRTFLEANARQKSFQLDYRLRRADGLYRWAIDSGHPHFSKAGVYLGFVGSVIDIHERKMAELERKRVEDALRTSEARYRTLFNSIDAGLCICELLIDSEGNPRDYRFLEVNHTFEHHTGLKDAIGKTALELIPTLEHHWIKTYGKVALTGEPVRFTQGSDAMGRWFDVYAFRFGFPDNLQVGILFNDITHRRQIETRLREREQRLAIASTAAQLGVFEWNVTKDIAIWENDRMYEIFGHTLADGTISKQQFYESYLHPGDHAEFERNLADAMHHDRHFHAICRIRRRSDGAQRWVEFNSKLDIRDSVNDTCMVGVLADITERKQRDDALRKSEEQLRLAKLAAGLGIHDYDIEAGIIQWDARVRELWGVEDDELITYDVFMNGLHPEDRTSTQAAIERAFDPAGSGELSIEYRVINRKDGLERWLAATGQVVSYKTGQAARFVGTVQDITERKQAEQRALYLQQLTAALSTAVTQKDVTQIITQHGIQHLDATAGTIAILTEDEAHLRMVVRVGSSGQVAERWQDTPLNHPTAPIALAVRTGKALWMGSLEERAVIVPPTPGLSTDEHQAWAIIPFNINDSFIGVVEWGYSTRKTFDATEKSFLYTLTDYYAQALDRARLTEQSRMLAAIEERQRLARDLHDSVSQVLFASTSMSENLPRTWAKNPERAMAVLKDVVMLNRGAWAEMRKLLLELRPEAIVRTPFPQLLEHLAHAAQAQKNFEIDLRMNMASGGLLPPDVHTTLYRIAQEAFNNIVKHSGATFVSLNCIYEGETFEMHISDDGQGFDVKRTTMGIGMNSMHERAATIGAALHIVSDMGKGTQIAIVWKNQKGTLSESQSLTARKRDDG